MMLCGGSGNQIFYSLCCSVMWLINTDLVVEQNSSSVSPKPEKKRELAVFIVGLRMKEEKRIEQKHSLYANALHPLR